MQLAIVSDTHVPSRADAIPEWVREAIRAADHTVHAGDFDSPSAYQAVVDLADGALTAVAGNVDPPGLGLPETASVDWQGVTLAVTHGTGARAGYEDRVAAVGREAGADVVVSGHTHEVLDARHGDLRHLNPGSATGADPATETTMMVAEPGDGDLDVTVRRG